jgi:hypothetical protein
MDKPKLKQIIYKALYDYHDALVAFLSDGDKTMFGTAKANIVVDAVTKIMKEGEDDERSTSID